MAEQHQLPKPYLPPIPIPPGETIKEVLEARDMSQLELSRRMGKPPQAISEIINAKKAITKETAIQLERVLGLPAYFWLNIERNYQDTLARDQEVAQLTRQMEKFKDTPYRELIKRGYLQDFKQPIDRLRATLNWLRVASYEALENYFDQSIFAYRKSPKFDLPLIKLAAWLRIGEEAHNSCVLEPFNPDALRARLPEIRSLTLLHLRAEWQPKLEKIGRECGVAFLMVKEFESFPVSGVTRWLNNNPSVQITLRGKRADIFWFTLFHEIGHVLLHEPRDLFIDVDHQSKENPFEAEADAFAADTLIPSEIYNRIERIAATQVITDTQIENWAREIGITPGIILGRLQRKNVLPKSWYYHLHQSLNWEEE